MREPERRFTIVHRSAADPTAEVFVTGSGAIGLASGGRHAVLSIDGWLDLAWADTDPVLPVRRATPVRYCEFEDDGH